MNLGGHIAVAAKLSDRPDVWLGAALPDVGAMGRFNLLGDEPKGEIAEGIALHHATDELFHGHDWFKTHQSNLFASLSKAGVRRGPAKAVAHVGPELLLDGELLAQPVMNGQISAGMARLIPNIDEVEVLVRPEKRAAWRGHLVHVAGRGAPTFYGDPHQVAASLERILSRRPRLALDRSQVELIGDLLSEVHLEIRATGVELIDDLAKSLG